MNTKIPRIIIHDLGPEELDIRLGENDVVISPGSHISPCIGCFGCWIKTPSVCVIKDAYQKLGCMLCYVDEIICISKCTYGGFSPFVKNVLDRSIGHLLPFFSIRNNEVHHTPRTENRPRFTVHFYGDISENERRTAQELIPANAINIVASKNCVYFYESSADIGRKTEYEDSVD